MYSTFHVKAAVVTVVTRLFKADVSGHGLLSKLLLHQATNLYYGVT